MPVQLIKLLILSSVATSLCPTQVMELALAKPDAMTTSAVPVRILRSDVIILSFLNAFFSLGDSAGSYYLSPPTLWWLKGILTGKLIGRQ